MRALRQAFGIGGRRKPVIAAFYSGSNESTPVACCRPRELRMRPPSAQGGVHDTRRIP